MSIEEKSIDATGEESSAQAPQQLRKTWYSFLCSPLWICLLVALLIRVWLTYHTHGVIDGDEAMVGIQAEHILRGEHPIYFYGQPYMGSLEAYLTALLFAIAGPSVWMLRAEPILLSLVVVYLTWRLAGALADAAKLSPFAQQLFKTIAALFSAIPPLYDTVLELRTLGGYIETFVLMLFLLLSAFQLTRRWQAGASKKELTWRWAVIGFTVGLGYWVNPLIVSGILATAIWIIGFCIIEPFRLGRQKATTPGRSPLAFLKGLLLAPVTIPACILGLAPALRWGSLYHWANFTFALQLGTPQGTTLKLQTLYPNRLQLIHDVALFYQKYILPRLIGGALPTESTTMMAIHTFTFDAGIFCLAATCLLLILSFFWKQPQLVGLRQLATLPLIFAFCTALAFCTSTISASGLIAFPNDIAGRYGTPLMLALPFFFSIIFTLVSVLLYTLGKRLFQIIGRDKEDAGYSLQRKPSSSVLTRLQLHLVAPLLVFAVMFAYLGEQAYTYVLTDPDDTYQSASCPMAPAYNDQIIAYLQQEHVHYGWAISWIANPIIFKTNDAIILTDPRPIIFHSGMGRIPADTEAVMKADRPSMLTLIRHDEAYPFLERLLDSKQVTYRAMRFPSQRGYDVLVLTSFSRTVSLYETSGFGAAFPNCI
ncbi:MAG: hypothetical protein ACJ8BW_33665 [Ktedonobacteraceae bacterium]